MEKSNLPTVVITRAESQSHDFDAALKKNGFTTFCLPTIEIRTRSLSAENENTLKKLKDGNYDWLIFTSSNGVTSLNEMAGDFNFPLKSKVAVIGDKTSQVFQSIYKREPELKPKKFIAESLIEEFSKQDIKSRKILLVTASKSRDVIQKFFRSEGAEIEELIVYDNIELKLEKEVLDKLANAGRLLFTFFSPSAVHSTYVNLGSRRDLLENADIVSIGPITSKAIVEKGLKVFYESPDHSEQGVLTIINKYVNLERHD